MTNTDKTINGQAIAYEIFEDGYEIYIDGTLWIKQRGEYSKPIDKELSYEENCLAQIEEITTVVEPSNPYGIDDTTYNSIIDDYTSSITSEVASSGY